MPGFMKRIAETFMSCLLFAVPLEFILLYNYVENTTFNTYAIKIIAALALIAVTIFFQRSYFVCFRDLKLYFKVNFAVYGIFALVNILLWFVLCFVLKMSNLYDLLFLPLTAFEVFNVNKLASALITHSVLLIISYLSPFFTNIDYLEELDDIEERDAVNKGQNVDDEE